MKSHGSHAGKEPYAEHPAVLPATSESEDRPFSELRRTFHKALDVITLRWWVFFIVFCLVTTTVFVGSLYIHPTFAASVRFERKDDPVLLSLPTSPGTGSFDYFRQTLERDIISVEYMTDVLETLGLARGLERDESGALTSTAQAHLEGLCRHYASFLRVATKERAAHLDLFEVSYSGPDLELGLKLVEEVKNTYIRRTGQLILRFLEEQQTYFNGHLQKTMLALDEVRKEQGEISAKNPLIDPTNPASIARIIEEQRREIRELQLQREQLQIQLSAQQQLQLQNELKLQATAEKLGYASGLSAQQPLSQAMARLLERIQEIDGQIEQLRLEKGMRLAHPAIQELLGRRHQLELAMADQQEMDAESLEAAQSAPSPQDFEIADPLLLTWKQENDRVRVAIGTFEQQINAVDARIKVAEDSIEIYREAQKEVYKNQSEYARIASHIGLLNGEAEKYRRSLADIAPVIKAYESGNAVKFDGDLKATGSRIPVSPKANVVVLMALAIGGAVAFVCVILAEVVDHVYRSSHQIARTLGLTILEGIDVIITSVDRRRYVLRRLLVSPVVTLVGLAMVLTSAAAAYFRLHEPVYYQRMMDIPGAMIDLFTHGLTGGADAPTAQWAEGIAPRPPLRPPFAPSELAALLPNRARKEAVP